MNVAAPPSDGPDTLAPVARVSFRDRLNELIDVGALELPLLPGVAAEVIQLSADEQCDTRKLADVIRRDAAMAGHLLHMANSVAFRGRTRVVSLHQAMSRLGMAQVRELAFVISCQSRIFRVHGREAEIKDLFAHSLATAILAQEIARTLRANVEEAFLAGLLHDVGKPVLMQAAADMTPHVAPFTEEELQSALEDLHAYVGSELAQRWGLSERLVEAIAHHHNPASAPTNTVGALVVHFADDVARFVAEGAPIDPRAHPAVPALNLYPEDVGRLLAMKDAIAARVEAVR